MNPYPTNPELELLEQGKRVAYCYDETFSVAYRMGEAAGIPRDRVPLCWQVRWRR